MRLLTFPILFAVLGSSAWAQPEAEQALIARSIAAYKAGHYDEASLWGSITLIRCAKLDQVESLTPESALALVESCSPGAAPEYSQTDRARAAFVAGNLTKAETYARELIIEAAQLPKGRSGQPLYYGNQVLGRILLKRGDVAGAKECLLASGLNTGAPVLSSFGPNLILARELLLAGERDTVLQFLDECSTGFWNSRADQIKAWQDVIRQGKVPDFDLNLRL